MLRNAAIQFRNGRFNLTKIDDERDDPRSLALRMTTGGFVVCRDKRWDKERVLIINLADVQSIELRELE